MLQVNTVFIFIHDDIYTTTCLCIFGDKIPENVNEKQMEEKLLWKIFR